jgi:hypothetical protein
LRDAEGAEKIPPQPEGIATVGDITMRQILRRSGNVSFPESWNSGSSAESFSGGGRRWQKIINLILEKPVKEINEAQN